MAVDLNIQRSRRSLLAAATGAAGALMAQALGRPVPTRAADGQTVVVGGGYTATSTTKLVNTTNSEVVIEGSSGPDGVGVLGGTDAGVGVWGECGTGVGVRGSGIGTGTGVHGSSNLGIGIHASNNSGDQPALVSQSLASNAAILAFSGVGSLPSAPVKTAVYGYAVQDTGSRGVWGRSNLGLGVLGEVTSGDGVHGKALSGRGGSFEATTGVALHAKGRVQLEQASGLGTILAGASNKTISPGFDLTASSKVLVTLLGHPGGTVTFRHVVVDATANTFTAYLTAAATNNTKFAWLVLV